jgi:mRNA interferase RelE/StbE
MGRTFCGERRPGGFAALYSVKKLIGVEGYRLRVGDWRVIYTLKHQTPTVIVVRVGDRSEVYK